MSIKKYIHVILEYILAFLIILEYFTVYRYLIPYRLIIVLGCIVLILLIISTSKYKRAFLPMTVSLIFYYLGSIIPFWVTSSETKNVQDNVARFIVDFLIILPLLWTYLSICKQSNSRKYTLLLRLSNFVFVLASISLLFWVLGSVLRIYEPNGIVPYFWEDGKYFIPSYYYLYFETQDFTFLGINLIRNSGIFTEAPVYNFTLCVSLLIETFYRDYLNKFKILIFILTILSTVTNTGQIFLFVYLLAVILCYGGRNKKKYAIPLLALILSAYIIVPIILEEKKNSGNPSYELREYALDKAMTIASENMLFGTGMFSNYELLGNNSLLLLFSEGGLYMLVLYIGAIIIVPILYMKRLKDKRWLIGNTLFLIVFTITIALYNWLTYLIIAWGLSNLNYILSSRRSINEKAVSKLLNK